MVAVLFFLVALVIALMAIPFFFSHRAFLTRTLDSYSAVAALAAPFVDKRFHFSGARLGGDRPERFPSCSYP